MPDCPLTCHRYFVIVRSVIIQEVEYKTPGQLIQALLDANGWSQRILAVVLGIDETGLNKIVAGKRAVDAELALGLSQIFNVRAEDILALQKEYDLAMAQLVSRPDPKLAVRASIFKELPVSEMVRRRWLPGVTDIRDLEGVEAGLCRFFGVSAIEEIEILPHAAKKTDVASTATPAQLAWLYRVRQIADDMLAGKFSQDSLRAAVDKLHPLRVSPDAARKVSRIMMECGVRLIFAEALPSSKIDGVCFWLDDRSPVIGMTLRFDRIDNFWFVLRHEIEHVLRGHGKSSAYLDTEMETNRAARNAAISEDELVADSAAAEFCVPQESLQKFISRKSPFFAERDILGFARTLGVHPGLVAGQLQRSTGRYDLFRNHLVKIRSVVLPGSMVDGWGDVAPVGA
jgi:HTH-type transcriptional regulator/antitoxin HigA